MLDARHVLFVVNTIPRLPVAKMPALVVFDWSKTNRLVVAKSRTSKEEPTSRLDCPPREASHSETRTAAPARHSSRRWLPSSRSSGRTLPSTRRSTRRLTPPAPRACRTRPRTSAASFTASATRSSSRASTYGASSLYLCGMVERSSTSIRRVQLTCVRVTAMASRSNKASGHKVWRV
jgi:hypothetical protein